MPAEHARKYVALLKVELYWWSNKQRDRRKVQADQQKHIMKHAGTNIFDK